jgi:uncharacterized membrane protein
MRRLSTIMSGLGALLFFGSVASADVMVCNDFLAPIHVALAAPDKGSFAAAGWWSVAPKACQTLDFAFKGAALYYAADSDSYPTGDKTSQDHWGNAVPLFVTGADFKFDGADRSRDGAKAEKFSLAEIPSQFRGKLLTVTLRFAQGATTVNVTSHQRSRRR